MDITSELEFHGIETNSQGAVELNNVKKLLDLYNQAQVDKARLEAHGERLVEAMELQSSLIEIFAEFANKIEKRHGDNEKTRKILDKVYEKIEAMSDHVDTLKEAPPIA